MHFSRPFSSPSTFSRRISSDSSPADFFLRLKQVAWLMPVLRQISATGVLSSLCFRTNAFCASENLDAFVVSTPLPAREM